MPDRISRSQIDQLGERIRKDDVLSEEDLTLLQTVRAEYDEILTSVAQRLADDLGLHPGFRLKTVGTIVDKLKRESIRLSQMQDIAGVRLVVEGGRSAQDALVGAIRGLFPETNVVDRRVNPSHGYRAVHVIATVDRRPVEIQVRTVLQDSWAQIFEAVADRFGRGIRYGQLPDEPESVEGEMTVQAFVSRWVSFSDSISQFENGPAAWREGELQPTMRLLLEALPVREFDE